MGAFKRQMKVTSGIFISKEVLKGANISEEDVELEVADGEVRIHRMKKASEEKVFAPDSPLWKCVGFADTEGINGRDHDKYVYDEDE